jgi:hypothetical protein
VQGPEQSRSVIQMLADKNSEALEGKRGTGSESAKAAGPNGPAAAPSLTDTLGEIVGLGHLSRGPTEPTYRRDAALAARNEEKTDFADRAKVAEDDAKTADADGSASLVGRRLEHAKTRASKANTPTNVEESNLLRKEAADSSATGRFITMVVEFALPEAKAPPSRGAADRPRS